MGTILAECTQVGNIGMVGANSITEFPITITGFTEVNNSNPSFDGFEEETDESLKQRYYESLKILLPPIIKPTLYIGLNL